MSIQIKSLTIGRPELDDPGMPAPGLDADFNVIPVGDKVYTLYKTPEGKSALVKGMRFSNTHTEAVTLSIWFNRPVQNKCRRRRLAPDGLTLPAGFTYIDDGEIALEAGDQIQAKAGTALKIQYVISGVERDEV